MVYKKKYKPNSSTSYPTHIGTSSYLIIVESPSKCKKIEDYLGNEYKCIASKGHLRELTGLKQISVKNNFSPTFTNVKEKQSHIVWMKKIIDQFPKSSIYIATDDDREGEGIAWHICELFHLPLHSTKRIIFHEITQAAVKSALKTPSTVNLDLVKAQQARQILDIVVGFKISPFLWKFVRGGKDNALSAGRCQTPALRLIYEREKEIQKSTWEIKYKVIGTFTSKHIDFLLNHDFDKEEEILGFLEKSKTFSHTMKLKPQKQSERKPPVPFQTSSLLQTTSNVLGYSPKLTMQLAQTLYQNGLITYMRTENTKYAAPFVETVKKYITTQYNDTYLGNFQKITNFDNKNPHEAIRVTNINVSTIEIGSKERSLYNLIWRNTLESCMANALYNVIPVEITAPKINSTNPLYKRSLELPIFLGWQIVKGLKNNDEEYYLYLKTLSETEKSVNYHKLKSDLLVKNKQTHYNESSLVNKLEELGIGRPSTFAMLVETIQDRGYVKKGDIQGKLMNFTNYILQENNISETKVEKYIGTESKKLYIEPIGIICIEFLLNYFNTLFDYSYTKKMEDKLDEISQGKELWYSICKECYEHIGEMGKALGTKEKESYKLDDIHEICFLHGGPCIKKTENNKVSFLPIKESIQVSIEKVKNNEYTLEELIAIPKEILGKYKDHEIKLKKGKFGAYLEYDQKNISLKNCKKEISNLTLHDAIEYIENQQEKTNSSFIPLNETMSIRQGKYGPYIFYKTASMKKPSFFPLKKVNYTEMSHSEIVDWVQSNHLK